jgi:ATP-binding cassette subfamily B (MDR/TAP) protein 1
LGIGVFYFVLFGYYAYGFYTGSWLITNKIWNSNTNAVYNIGDILSCFFGVIFGVMSLGMAAPNMKIITEGRMSGKMAYEIIERKPKIWLDDPTTMTINDLQGHIELRNINFTYPTRQDQKILDNFSAVFEKGKTTALVGASGSGKSTII